MKVALYIRVSSEEQVVHGYSIEAQQNALLQYAKDNKYTVYGIYKDEGISARKPYTKRPEMLRLLSDAKSRKFDTVLFCKLDRWFRNIKEYFKVQDILEVNNIKWKAILEDYDTISADGRLKVNIMLSVAENEADRTSERIKFVQREKLARREAITTLPYGYRLQDKKPVKDENIAPIIEAMFKHYLTYRNINKLTRDMNAKFNLNKDSITWGRRLKNPAYKGTMYGIDDFCPAYISPKTFDEVQKIKKERAIKETHTDRITLFSALLKCPVCGNRLASAWYHRPNTNYRVATYRCNNYWNRHKCTFGSIIYENKTEKFLLDKFPKEAETQILKAEIERKSKSYADPNKLRKKLDRLTDVYIMGNISKEEYEKKTAEIKAEILEAESEINSEQKEKVINAIGTINTLYSTLDRQSKQVFWHSLIDVIEVERTTPIKFKLK